MSNDTNETWNVKKNPNGTYHIYTDRIDHHVAMEVPATAVDLIKTAPELLRELADITNRIEHLNQLFDTKSARIAIAKASGVAPEKKTLRLAKNPKTGKYWDGSGFTAAEVNDAAPVPADVTAADFAKIFSCPVMVFNWVDDDYTYLPGSNFGDWEKVDHANCKEGEGY